MYRGIIAIRKGQKSRLNDAEGQTDKRSMEDEVGKRNVREKGCRPGVVQERGS